MNDVEWNVLPILDEKLQYIVKKSSKHNTMAELKCSFNTYLNEGQLNEMLFKGTYKYSPQNCLKIHLWIIAHCLYGTKNLLTVHLIF